MAARTLTVEDLLFKSKDRKDVDKAKIQLDSLVINCIRSLAMDSVQKANSGHPGTPMAMAPVAYALWARVLNYDPTEPLWMNRDRFVLSMGHASMLLYGLLHVAGVREVGDDGGHFQAVNLLFLWNTSRTLGNMVPNVLGTQSMVSPLASRLQLAL